MGVQSFEKDHSQTTEETPLLQQGNGALGDRPPRSSVSWLAHHVVGVCKFMLITAMAMYLLVLFRGGTKPNRSKDSLCLTPACVHASSEILYNLSPNYMDIDPCTDFEQLVCGGWDDRHDLRPDQGDAFTGTLMFESSQMLLRHILENSYPKESKHSSFSPAQLVHSLSSIDEENFNKLKDAYDACMDEDTIKKDGVAPLMEILSQVADMFPSQVSSYPIGSSLTSKDTEIVDTVLYLAKLGISALASFGAGADDRDPDTVVVQVSSPWRIGLPAKDYYKDENVLKKYEDALFHVMESLYPDGLRRNATSSTEWTSQYTDQGHIAIRSHSIDYAHDVVEFEKKLAAASPDAEDQNDVTKYYNPMSLADAELLAPQIQISKIIKGLAPADFKTSRIIVMSPQYLKDLAGILSNTPREVLQTYFLWKTIQYFASDIEADALKPLTRFSNELQGKDPDSTPERWRTCVGHVDDGLGWILSRFFVEKAFSAKAKEFGDQIVSDIKDMFVKKLKTSTWMDESVIELAIEKVHKIVQKIGYPTKSPNIMDPPTLRDYYSSVHVTPSTFFNNSASMSRFEVAREWSALGRPVDRDEWGMTVPTVNAYYNPPGNEIVFPAGIMQFPVFDVNVPQYLSYGAFGSVSGHELSHAFDSTGRHYDQNGNYTDWWTNHTVAGFEDRADCFVKQYANFSVPGPDDKPLHVNGRLTLGENIADAGGVSAAFAAWKGRQADGLVDQGLPGLDYFTHEQLFFVSYANWWCGKSRKETAIQRIYTDPHAPKWARILGTMANSRDFRTSFGCVDREPVCELW